MAQPLLVESVLLKQFSRFLHLGLKENKYYPGCWSSHDYFEISKLPELDDILEVDPVCQDVIDIIVKTYKDGLFSRYDTIAFAICKCLHLGNDEMKKKIYDIILDVCKTPKEFITFADYTFKFKTGHGRGWSRTVTTWYRVKDPMELAQEVMRIKGCLGCNHNRVMRKAHLKIDENDIVRNAIVKFVMFGPHQANEAYGDKPQATPVLAYMTLVHELRRCEDSAAAARIIRDNDFTLEHVPGHLLTSQEVWEAVLPSMSLQQLLSNLLRIHHMGFLTDQSATTAIVVSLLTNPDYVTKSRVPPIAVYIAYCCYVNKSRPMKNPKIEALQQKKARRRQRQHRDPDTQEWVWNENISNPRVNKYLGMDSPPNPLVANALMQTLSLSWPRRNKRNTVRYLITMDMREHMFKGRHFVPQGFRHVREQRRKKKKPKPATVVVAVAAGATSSTSTPEKCERGDKRQYAECFYYKCVTPGDAALVMALSIYKRDRESHIAVFTDAGVQVVDLGQDRRALTLASAKEKLTKAGCGPVKADAPIEWADRRNIPFDVFINIMDRPSRCAELDPADRTGRLADGRYDLPPPGDVADHCPARALERYRLRQHMPHTRLITMSLATHKVQTGSSEHRGMLDIIGIDQHVPGLIDAFAARQFD